MRASSHTPARLRSLGCLRGAYLIAVVWAAYGGTGSDGKGNHNAEQGDAVVARFLERGTSVGPFRGQAPTGKSSEVVATEWFTFQNGCIHRRWGVGDSAAHFRQRGLPLG